MPALRCAYLSWKRRVRDEEEDEEEEEGGSHFQVTGVFTFCKSMPPVLDPCPSDMIDSTPTSLHNPPATR